MAERKKLKPDIDAARPEDASVGATLRAARLARGLEIENVSQSIHIRPTQLRAIEDGDIDALPGMTYAVGFVRGYANFLGLNGAEIVHRFKAEQGHSPMQSKLSFPEPIAESRVPDPMMVGVGAFLAVVILVLWTVYSNMHNGSKTAEQIPPAPVVTSVAETLPSAPAPAASPSVTETTSGPPASGGPLAVPPVPETPVAAAPVKAGKNPPKAAKTAVDQTADASSDSDSEEEDSASAEDDAAAVKPAKDQNAVINITPGKSRIVLKATQASWVQVTDDQQNVLYRKVLRPGEQYSVPDQPGLSLDTANAGGLDIIVDGRKVQALGKPGEIMRGVILDPKELQIQKIKVRD